MAKGYIPGIGTGGSGGGTPNPDPADLQDGEMVRFDQASGEMEGSGDINTDLEVDFGSKDIKCKTVITESASIDVGPGITLSDRGGFLQNHSNISGDDFLSVDYMIDDSGTTKPIYYSRAAKVVRAITQPDDSVTMVGLTSYAVTPTTDQDILKVYVKLVNPLTNYRARVISDVTGEVVKYVPSRNDWENGTGLDFAAGEQSFDIVSPLAELVGYPLTVEVLADQSIDVLGDGTNPWRAVDSQNITKLNIIDESDVALESVSTSLIYGCEPSIASATTVDIAAGRVRKVTLDSENAPTVEVIDVGPFTGVAIPDVLTQAASLITLDSNQQPEVLPVSFTDSVIRNNVVTGEAVHPAGTVTSVLPLALRATNLYSQQVSMLNKLGTFRSGGLSVTPNADLTMTKLAGFMTSPGVGVAFDSDDENTTDVAGQAPCTFRRYLGATGTLIEESSSTSLLDPGFWDNGTGAKVAISGSPNQATNVFVFQTPTPTGGLNIAYGQNLYPTVQDAQINAATEAHEIPTVISSQANLLTVISLRSGATDLQLDTDAVFQSGPKFGVERGGALGSSGNGGGDVIGAADSSLNEIATYADLTGKALGSSSDMSALNGTVGRIGAGTASFEHSNGINRLELTGSSARLIAKNSAANNTTTWTLIDSNGTQYGGSSITVNSGNGSVGYKASLNNTFACQIYWNQAENRTHVSHRGTNANPAADIVLANNNVTMDFLGNKALSITNTGQLDVEGSAAGVTLKSDAGAELADWTVNSGSIQLGVPGFGNAAHLNFEGNFASIVGGTAGWSQLSSGGATVRAEGTTGDVIIEDNGLSSLRLNNTTGNIELTDGADGAGDFFFGRWRLRNPTDSPGVILHDSTDLQLGSVLWDSADNTIEILNGTGVAPNNRLQVSEAQTKSESPVIVNSLEDISCQGLQVNEEFSDAGDTDYYADVPLMVNLLADNGGSTLAPPETALSLHRSGIPSEAYGNSARFDLSRYEDSNTNMRTQLDIRLGHNQPTAINEGANTPTILSMRSNGQVSMPTTSAAFVPPVVTTAQRGAIAPVAGGILYDSDIEEHFTSDGASWNALATTTSVVGRVAEQQNIAMSGIFQIIGSGTFVYYDVNGSPFTPNFVNGVWTVDATGVYQFNVRGWPFTGTGSESQARFYVSVNGGNYTTPDVGLQAVAENGAGLSMSGQVKLEAGDTVAIGYSVLSGTGWELDAFAWDFARQS